jgi:hypothetical protein
MSYSRQMLDTYPGTFGVDAAVGAAAIDALSDCAQACTADVDADLSEQNLAEMVRCIRLCLDCVDVCTATLGVTSRQADYDADVTKPLLRACMAICISCGDECERHAQHYEHCRVGGRPGAQPAPPDDAETVARASRGPGAWKVTRQTIALAIASSAY